MDTYFSARDTLAPVGRKELLARTERAEVVVLDVRPREEFEAGHIPGAISIPLDELRERLDELCLDEGLPEWRLAGLPVAVGAR